MNPRAKDSSVFSEIEKLWASRLGLMSLAFALGGAVGTGALPVVQGWFGNGTEVAIDSTFTYVKELRDALPPIKVAQEQQASQIQETREVVRRHSDYLFALYSPWNTPYRGPR